MKRVIWLATLFTGSVTAATIADQQRVPGSLEMGGKKSVTTFFVTSRGVGRGGDLGGLAGADAHCQALAQAEGSGDHTWRAYLSVSADAGRPAVNARDRIGKGPWYNAEGTLVAANIDDLHRTNKFNKQMAVTERLDPVNGVGDTATTGAWTRVNPVGTSAQPEDDHSVPGTMCFVTGQGSVGGGDGDNDVDGGVTTLRTNILDASGLSDPYISYWRWFSNNQGGAPGEDTFLIDISNNGGSMP